MVGTVTPVSFNSKDGAIDSDSAIVPDDTEITRFNSKDGAIDSHICL